MKNIELDYQKNLRDIGGMKTKDGRQIKMGRLYRSGHLHKVSQNDIEILEGLKLTDIVDFRSQSEFLGKADIDLLNVEKHNLPALEEDINKRHIPVTADKNNGDFNLLSQFSLEGFEGRVWMKHLYADLVESEIGIKAYTSFFKLLSSKENGVFLWHCSQGKDRAGLAAFLLEMALGVDIEKAKEDYMHTQIAMELKIKQLAPIVQRYCGDNNIDLGMENLREVFSADLVYLDTAIECMKKKSGSVERYLVDVLHVDIERLRSLYLSD